MREQPIGLFRQVYPCDLTLTREGLRRTNIVMQPYYLQRATVPAGRFPKVVRIAVLGVSGSDGFTPYYDGSNFELRIYITAFDTKGRKVLSFVPLNLLRVDGRDRLQSPNLCPIEMDPNQVYLQTVEQIDAVVWIEFTYAAPSMDPVDPGRLAMPKRYDMDTVTSTRAADSGSGYSFSKRRT